MATLYNVQYTYRVYLRQWQHYIMYSTLTESISVNRSLTCTSSRNDMILWSLSSVRKPLLLSPSLAELSFSRFSIVRFVSLHSPASLLFVRSSTGMSKPLPFNCVHEADQRHIIIKNLYWLKHSGIFWIKKRMYRQQFSDANLLTFSYSLGRFNIVQLYHISTLWNNAEVKIKLNDLLLSYIPLSLTMKS